MDQPGLDPTLEPSRALRKPYTEYLGPVFEGGQRDRFDTVAPAAKPNPEVCVFGDVVRIPAADLIERGPSKVRPYVAKAPSFRER